MAAIRTGEDEPGRPEAGHIIDVFFGILKSNSRVGYQPLGFSLLSVACLRHPRTTPHPIPMALLPKAQSLKLPQTIMTPFLTILLQTRKFAASAYPLGEAAPTKMPKN